MKSVIVIYYPAYMVLPPKETLKEELAALKPSWEILTIMDTNRKKIEVDVFFKPE